MDPWRHDLTPSTSTREKNKSLLSQFLRNAPTVQFPVSNESTASFSAGVGSFEDFGSSFSSSIGSFGSINQFLSGPASAPNNSFTAVHENRLAPEMARLGSNPLDMAPNMARLASSPVDHAWSMGTGSPQLFPEPQPQSMETSPCLLPDVNEWFTEIDLNATAPIPIYQNDDLSPLSAGSMGSIGSNSMFTFSANTGGYNVDPSSFNSMSQQMFNDFFTNEMLLDSRRSMSTQASPYASPEMAAQDASGITPAINIPSLGLSGRRQSISQVSPSSNPSDYSIIPMQMNQETGTIGPKKNATATGRRAVGRKGPLDAATKKKAASMRGHACGSCRRRKASCDHATPCRACIRYYGVTLIDNPCRGKMLDNLAASFLDGPIFPRKRSLESFLDTAYKFHDRDCHVKLTLGFGAPLAFRMKIVRPSLKSELVHNHIVYQWPPQANAVTARCSCQHCVFPAIIADTTNLKAVLDHHLGVLVDNYFDDFPAYDSALAVLRPVYAFYRKLPVDEEPHEVLRQVLKLLTLVHVGGDTQICPQDPTARLIATKFFGHAAEAGSQPHFSTCPSNLGKLPTPCFIRGQLGAVMPLLAHDLMKDVLARLEKMSLGRECPMWANACATFAVFVMAIESIEYHTQKIAFHAQSSPAESSKAPTFGPPAPPGMAAQATAATPAPASGTMDKAFDHLLGFYKACFSGCHGRLTDESRGRSRSGSSGSAAALSGAQRDAQEKLVAELKQVLANAQPYLHEKSRATCKTSDDLSCFFDRSLSKLFLVNAN